MKHCLALYAVGLNCVSRRTLETEKRCVSFTWAKIGKVPVKIGGHTKWMFDVWTVVFANVADTPERRVNPIIS